MVKRNGNETREVAYALPSAGPEWADAGVLRPWWRGPWGIENRVPWVREVTWGEDASRIRTEGAAEVLVGRQSSIDG
jgi:hypothetical protein